MELNLLTTDVYPDKEICSKCKHYKESVDEFGRRQLLDQFCCKCYSSKVFIVTRFEKKEDKKRDQ